jgi:hypothetical protein
MKDLRREKVTADIPSGSAASLFVELQSPNFAVWAYCAARRFIHAILDLTGEADSVSSLRNAMRNTAMFPD